MNARKMAMIGAAAVYVAFLGDVLVDRASGAASYNVIDLNPGGFSVSIAKGISGTQQVGYGYRTPIGGDPHALLWSGTSASAIDLTPSGFAQSTAWGTNGTQQVGYGYRPATGGRLPDVTVDATPESLRTSCGESSGFAWRDKSIRQRRDSMVKQQTRR